MPAALVIPGDHAATGSGRAGLPKKNRPLGLLPRFTLIFLGFAIALSILLAIIARFDDQVRLRTTLVREKGEIEVAKTLLSRELASVAVDLHFLARLPALQDYLDQGSAKQHQQLTNSLRVFAEEAKRYDQLRLVDINGQEIVRINRNDGSPSIASDQKLQSKAGRYYFRDSIVLSRGEIYVSPLDLNVEHDRLELPHKPMLRLATPVFDSEGRKQGVLILNYLAGELLRRFRDAGHDDAQGSFMLLNRDGFWLSGPRREDEWGFMLGRLDRNFAHDFPQEWRAISASEHGSMRTDLGLFVYDTLRPMQTGQRSSTGAILPQAPSQHEVMASEYQWKLVSLTSDELLMPGLIVDHVFRPLLALAYLFLALVAWILAYLNVSRQKARAELKESESRQRQITDTMSEGLLVMDTKLQIESVNPAFERITGFPAGEAIGRTPKILFSGKHDDAFFHRLHERVDEKGRWLGEIWNRRRNGEVFPQQTSINAMRGEDGQIHRYATVFSDSTAQKQLEDKLREMSTIDGLTGIANRRRFDEVLAQEWARALRDGAPLSLLMADIDFFKGYNDRRGHLQGDICLQQVAHAIDASASRASDLAARYGGEEFAVILPSSDAAAAAGMGEKIRAAVAALALPHGDSKAAAFVTISVGVATVTPQQTLQQAALIAAADRALYQAKHSGRNRVVVASGEALSPTESGSPASVLTNPVP